MKRFKKYLSLLFLALLLFPVLEKTSHELKHLNEKHCAGKGLHYCADEKNCDVCDYVFSNAGSPPASNNQLINIRIQSCDDFQSFVSNEIKPNLYNFSLRGPPKC